MLPQQQLRKEPNGDCLRAAIATLLEIKIGNVPDFVTSPEIESEYPSWWVALQSWLAELGLFFLEIQLPPNMPWMPLPVAALCILFGETTSGVKHCIVGRCEGADYFPVFNPWPEAEFAGGVAAIGFIVPRDPATPVNFGRAMERISKFASNLTGDIGENICAEVDAAFHRQQETIDGLKIER